MKKKNFQRHFWIYFVVALIAGIVASFLQPVIQKYFPSATVILTVMEILILSLIAGLIGHHLDKK